jgi:hypothetical protein
MSAIGVSVIVWGDIVLIILKEKQEMSCHVDHTASVYISRFAL